MTARIADCTTLLELAFGLNLAISAVAYKYIRYEQAIRIRLEKAVEGSEQKQAKLYRPAIDRLAATMTRRLRRKVYLSILCSLSILLASFVGLLSAAEHPNYIISDKLIDFFGIMAIVVTPLASAILKSKADATIRDLRQVRLDDEELRKIITNTAIAVVLQRGIRFPTLRVLWRSFLILRKNETTLGALRYLLHCPGFYILNRNAFKKQD